MPKQLWIELAFPHDEEVDKNWRNWAEAEHRSSQDLAEIVYGPFKEPFQKRALFLLLTPEVELVPFYWPHKFPSDYLEFEIDFQKINESLRASASYWIIKLVDFTKYKLGNDNKRECCLDAYNKYILQLLALFPQEDNNAEDLFSYFSINDQASWSVGYEHPGYTPLLNLWKNPLISEKWKKSADAEIRRIIKDELRAKSFPRLSHENALECYAKHLQSVVSENPFPYGKDFLADQLNFLVSLEVADWKLIKPESVGRILNLLKEERFSEIKHKLIRFAVLRDGNFNTFNEQVADATRAILQESNDHQVLILLQDKLTAYEKVQITQKERIQERQEQKEALLAPMRKIAPGYPEEYGQ